ncbi:hypothetical protein I8J29_24385 [Paenibacillus sp. MWE-103]|uniref:WXG100 family type VII secretion target n=1 Tax=Paenibacillus artemisiicola TaxID=1172618 RepID=A0ABS3WGB2_9BACL|nr:MULTISPECIES: hypothetical protein [Paenibacillus]MBO7747327.1 hypothetical protein [Paenibacillus artemisiicola]SFI81094.1 hypothetical protein SAMN02799624_02302 [Paenibacillus sp. UNC496MF]
MASQAIDQHLREALAHLEQAINQSIDDVQADPSAKQELGGKWQHFLGEFYGMVKEKGVKTRINLLSWISFARLR